MPIVQAVLRWPILLGPCPVCVHELSDEMLLVRRLAIVGHQREHLLTGSQTLLATTLRRASAIWSTWRPACRLLLHMGALCEQLVLDLLLLPLLLESQPQQGLLPARPYHFEVAILLLDFFRRAQVVDLDGAVPGVDRVDVLVLGERVHSRL